MLTTGFLEGRYLTPHNDLHAALQNPWRKSNIGTTGATISIACPKPAVGERIFGVAITTLYATGSGGTLSIADSVGNEIQYLLTATPLQMIWPKGFPIEKGLDLTITITGAASGASISATGIILP